MPQFSFAYRRLAIVSMAAVLGSSGALAQSAPVDIPGVVTVCAPVVSEQYSGDKDRWGYCVAAVEAFLDTAAPSASTDDTVADLVVGLAGLYRDEVTNCTFVETELPMAIQLAAQRVTDEERRAQIVEISATIADCQQFATAAIVQAASPF